MKRLLLAAVFALWGWGAQAEIISVTPSGNGGGFPPAGCVTANGVIFNNATPCDSGFTYAGSGGQVSINGAALGATTGLLVNPASASGLLADFQVNGTSKAKINNDGTFTTAVCSTAGGIVYNSSGQKCDGGLTYGGNGGEISLSGGTVSGSATTPFLSTTGTWNTSGVVDAAWFMGVTVTASGTNSKLVDIQAGAAGNTPRFQIWADGTILGASFPFGNATAVANASPGLNIGAGATLQLWNNALLTEQVFLGGVRITSSDVYQIWSGGNILSGSADTSMSRGSAGVMQFGTGAANALGTVNAAGYQVGGAAGASCTLTVIAHLTVVNGIVTLCN